MQKRFEGKTAVITGGASGIGLAIARRFVQEGGKIVANDINTEGVAALAAELGPSGIALIGDVTREDDVAHLFSTAIDRFGAVDATRSTAGMTLAAWHPARSYQGAQGCSYSQNLSAFSKIKQSHEIE